MIPSSFERATSFLANCSPADQNRIPDEWESLKKTAAELNPQGSKFASLSGHRKGKLEGDIEKFFQKIELKLRPLSPDDIRQKQVHTAKELMGKLSTLSPSEFYKELKNVDFSLQGKILQLVWIIKGCPDKAQYSENLLKQDTSILKQHELSKLGLQNGTILEQLEAEINFNHQLTEAQKNNPGSVAAMIRGKVQFFQDAVNGNWFTPIQLNGLFDMMQPAIQEELRRLGMRPPLFGKVIDRGLLTLAPAQFCDALNTFAPHVKKKICELVWVASGCPKQDNFSRDLLKQDTSILGKHFPSLMGLNAGTIFEQAEAELLLDDRLTQMTQNKQNVDALIGPKIAFFQDRLREIEWTHTQMKARFHLMHPAVQAGLKNLGIQPPFYGRGFNPKLHETLGAHYNVNTGRTTFRVYAPNASKVVLNLTAFGQIEHACALVKGPDGVWSVETNQAIPGRSYYFMVTQKDKSEPVKKVDPFALQNYIYCSDPGRDNHESIVTDFDRPFVWSDQAWMAHRKCDPAQQPLTIYEIHSPTWQLDDQGKALNWRALAPKLANYCKTEGYNAIELMALFAHTQPVSMGYQITNYFAPNSDMGSWEDFQYFVNYMHNVDLGNGRTGIRLIADWVPAHFALDEWALSNFDGTPMLENEDPSVAFHPKWGTKIFDFKRQFTKDFFISNADFLLDKLHIDGLRVDAVSSMLFYNYDREKQISEGNYKKRFNRHGSEIDSDAKGFIRNMNNYIHTRYPEALMIAEEATGFSNLTRPPEQRGESATRRGLGFDLGWHMGWMNDSLKYWVMSSPERKNAFSLLTHTVENVDGGSDIHPRGTVVLAYSHDETANGKGTILGNMPSGASGRDRSQKYANGRMALAYQLLRGGGPTLDFMGNELLQSTEWHGRLKENIERPKQKAKSTVQWEELDPTCDTAEYQFHRGSQTCRRDLNHLFLNSPGLCDQTDHGFSWINATDSTNCVMSFHRRSRDDKQQFACIFNTSDRDISDYLIALPDAKSAPELDGLVGIREVYNTDALVYGGKGRENQHVEIVRDRATGRPTHFKLRLPPCTAIVLQEYFS